MAKTKYIIELDNREYEDKKHPRKQRRTASQVFKRLSKEAEGFDFSGTRKKYLLFSHKIPLAN